MVAASTQFDKRGSPGIEQSIEFLNSAIAQDFSKTLVLKDEKLKKEMDSANFWSGNAFTIAGTKCTGIFVNGLAYVADCLVNGKRRQQEAFISFANSVEDENKLKNALIQLVC